MPLAGVNKSILEHKLNTSNEKGFNYNGVGQLVRECDRLWILGTMEVLILAQNHALSGNTWFAKPEPTRVMVMVIFQKHRTTTDDFNSISEYGSKKIIFKMSPKKESLE